MSLLPAEVSRSSDARVTPQRISLEIGLPVLLASGAHYATLAVRTIAEVGFRGAAMSAEDDLRWCDITLPIELPSGEHLTLSTSLPLALFGRVPGIRQETLPVVLPEKRQEHPIVVNLPETVVNVNVPAPIVNIEVPSERKTTPGGRTRAPLRIRAPAHVRQPLDRRGREPV